MKENILIVEDEKDIAEMIRYNLEKEGYKVSVASKGSMALELLEENSPDLVILDIMLPDIDGFEVCRKMRSEPATSAVPVIFLSAKSQEMDKVVGLELGADDYMTKPFSPRELIARIKAVLRRKAVVPAAEKLLSSGDIVIDVEKHKVKAFGKSVELTPTEFSILEYMYARPGRVLSREKLLNGVFGYDSSVYDRTVDAHIKSLRKKLGKAKNYIETVRGIGYRFKEDEDEE